MLPAEVNVPFELSFRPEKKHRDIFHEINIAVRFEGPDGVLQGKAGELRIEKHGGRNPLYARGRSITENRHGTHHFYMRTYVTARHKITVYRDGDEGELFDLQEDPGEIRNLWRDPGSVALKSRLLHEFLQATLQSEPVRMPRIAGA